MLAVGGTTSEGVDTTDSSMFYYGPPATSVNLPSTLPETRNIQIGAPPGGQEWK